jgi:CheY-like chemotaxis protein
MALNTQASPPTDPFSEAASATGSPGPPPAAAGADGRVLIIDDHRDNADTLGEILALQGHAVEVAYSAREGLEAARRFCPSLVLCDIGLPDLDGYAVARSLLQEPALSGVRLVALTGHGRAEDRTRAREAGFDLHLLKPLDQRHLSMLLMLAESPPCQQ